MTNAWGALATYRQMKRQRFKVYLTKGIRVNPKAYCCDDPEGVTAAKPPVAILTATPNPVYAGANVTLDLSNSYDPNGAALAAHHIWDGQGADQAGVNWVQGYPNAGRFEAMGVVTDATGLQGQASVWVEVLSANGDNPPEPPGDWRKSVYLAAKVDGIFFTEDFCGPGAGDPEWELVITGLGTTNTRCIVGDPWDPSGRQYTRTTEPKIYRRTGGDWGVILDSADVEAATGRTIQAGLRMIGPAGNINAEGHVYAVVYFLATAGAPYYLYFFWSDDYGDTWTAYEIANTWIHTLLVPSILRVGAFRGSSAYAGGYVIYVVANRVLGGDDQLFVSVDQGQNWAAGINLAHCRPSSPDGRLTVQGADQDIIYWVGRGSFVGGTEYTLQKSINRGGAFTNLWVCAATPSWTQSPNIYHWGPLSAFIADGANGLRWTEDDWANHVLYANGDDFDVDGCSRVMDAPELLYGWQANNPGGGDMQHVIAVSEDRGVNWEGKAGDDPVTPSATSIPNDCGGVAGILQVWTEE